MRFDPHVPPEVRVVLHAMTGEWVPTPTAYSGITGTLPSVVTLTQSLWQQRVQTTNGPQNPPNKRIDMLQIMREARRQAEAKEVNARAWGEFNDCINANPIVVAARREYARAWGKAYEESWHLELHALAVAGDTGYHVYEHYRKYGAVKIISHGMIRSNAGGFLVAALLAGVPREVSEQLEKNRDAKIKPIREECAKKVQEKFGFVPTAPR